MSLSLLVIDPAIRNAALVAVAIALACAALSVFVVSRHWAFVGEGISHSGFGGAGTAWMLAVFFPALDQPWVPYVAVVAFCIATAVAIGLLSARGIATDTAVGIFLVASVAWGFVGQQLYLGQLNRVPVGFENILFGRQLIVPDAYAVTAICVCAAVLVTVAALGREIVAYCFEPTLARASGVRTGFIHHLLIILIAITISVSIPMVGSILVTALLVLPGATALALSRQMSVALGIALGTAVTGAVVGLLAHHAWPFLPTGPAIVLVLFLLFVVGFTYSRVRR